MRREMCLPGFNTKAQVLEPGLHRNDHENLMPDTDPSRPDLERSPSVAGERRSQLAVLIPEAFSEGSLTAPADSLGCD